MLARIRTEPALITGLVTALIALGVSFGLHLSTEQIGGILALVAAVLAFLTRAAVTPNASVAASVNDTGQTVAGPASTVVDGTPVTVTEGA